MNACYACYNHCQDGNGRAILQLSSAIFLPSITSWALRELRARAKARRKAASAFSRLNIRKIRTAVLIIKFENLARIFIRSNVGTGMACTHLLLLRRVSPARAPKCFFESKKLALKAELHPLVIRRYRF